MGEGPQFGLIERAAGSRRRKRLSFVASAAVQGVVLAVLMVGVVRQPAARTHASQVTMLELEAPASILKLAMPPARRMRVRPARRMRRLEVKRPELAKPVLRQPVPTRLPNAPRVAETTPAPVMAMPRIAAAPRAAVALGSFRPAVAAAPVLERRRLEASGFGASSPVRGTVARGHVAAAGFNVAAVPAEGTKTSAVASAGFGAAGAATGGGRSRGIVGRAGFGSASAGRGPSAGRVEGSGFGTAREEAGGGRSAGAIRNAGFGVGSAVRPAAATAKRLAETTPVEVVYKPDPIYTAEARRLGIQGAVVLAVRFGADGRVRVERVIRGLGHGLDKAAERAAEQMKFHPARRDGVAVETEARIEVTFELAR